VATTPEQRNRHAMCGAKKRNGETCRAYAGQGTDHPGTGACKFHGGATRNHGKSAVKQELTRRMVTLGEPVENVTAVSALLSELYASTGHVEWLRQEIATMSKDDLGTIEGLAIVRLYDTERDRKTRIAKLCSEAGVDEAAVRVAEAQVTILGNALQRACDTAGIDDTTKRRIGAALRDELAAAQAQPQPMRALSGAKG
jgi:hypothetical protein